MGRWPSITVINVDGSLDCVPPQRLHVDMARWTLKILYGPYNTYITYLVHSYFRLSRNKKKKKRRYARYIDPRNYIYTVDRNGFYNFLAYKMLYTTWNEFLHIYVISSLHTSYMRVFLFFLYLCNSIGPIGLWWQPINPRLY